MFSISFLISLAFFACISFALDISSNAFAILFESDTIFASESEVISAYSFALSIPFMHFSISSISVATTANPLPASPALAASTEAFNARILVWKAIPSIVFTIFLISSDISSTVLTTLESSCIF